MTNPDPQTITRVDFFRMPTGSSTAYVQPEGDPVTQDQTTADTAAEALCADSECWPRRTPRSIG
jgi:hypothetical protein